MLWAEGMYIKVRAKGIATGDFLILVEDKGTVILAAHNFKALSLREILEQNQIEDVNRGVTS